MFQASKNIYILMQSETLRTLGQCLCGSSKIEDFSMIFNIVQQYTTRSSSILSELKNLYNRFCYPMNITTEEVNSLNSDTSYLNTTLNNISSTLHGLLIDSRKMQDFIHENSFEYSSINKKLLGKNLLNIQRQMTYLMDYINSSSQVLLKETMLSFNKNPIFGLPDTNEKVTKTGFTVGMSDFSVVGGSHNDDVYSKPNVCNQFFIKN